ISRALPSCRTNAADTAAAPLYRERLQPAASRSLWRARISLAGDRAPLRPRRRLHRRRVRPCRAARPHAIARRGGAARPRGCGDVGGQPAAGDLSARLHARRDAAWREPVALGRPYDARRDLSRRPMNRRTDSATAELFPGPPIETIAPGA